MRFSIGSDVLDKKDFTEINRKSWNEACLKHRNARLRMGDPILQEGYLDLDENLIKYLRENVELKGARVVGLCCNDGREIISLKRMGAEECVGFDISDEAITSAQDLSEKTGVQCQFIRSDVYDIDPEGFEPFDLAFISAGAICWLPDLEGFFQIVFNLLKPGGKVFLNEIHPFAWLLEDSPPETPLLITGSYFKEDPIITHGDLDYVGGEDYEGLPNYSFDHTLGEIISSIAKAGIKVELFKEFPQDISAVFSHLEKMDIKLPLSFIILGKKVS